MAKLLRSLSFWCVHLVKTCKISLPISSLKNDSLLHDQLCLNTASLCPAEANALSTLPASVLGGFLLWAVPKKRTSHSKKAMRMTHKYLKPKHHYTVCPKCKNLKLLHVLCGHCLKETLMLTARMRRKWNQSELWLGRGTQSGTMWIHTVTPSIVCGTMLIRCLDYGYAYSYQTLPCPACFVTVYVSLCACMLCIYQL